MFEGRVFFLMTLKDISTCITGRHVWGEQSQCEPLITFQSDLRFLQVWLKFSLSMIYFFSNSDLSFLKVWSKFCLRLI